MPATPHGVDAASALLATWSGLCVGVSIAKYRQTQRPTRPIRTSSGPAFTNPFEGANRCQLCGGVGKTVCGSCAGAGQCLRTLVKQQLNSYL